MEAPENQHQLVLWYLFNWESFSLKDVINHSMFFKFQTRLSEIEKIHGEIAQRSRNKFINRFGHKKSFNTYSCENKALLKKLFNKYKKS
jgi:hypothetical protein